MISIFIVMIKLVVLAAKLGITGIKVGSFLYVIKDVLPDGIFGDTEEDSTAAQIDE